MHVCYASCALALNFVNFAFSLPCLFSHTFSVSIGTTACAARTETRYSSNTRNPRIDLGNAWRSCEEQYFECVVNLLHCKPLG